MKDVIRDDRWAWPSANTWELMKIKREEKDSPLNSEDMVKWNATSTRAIITHSAWEIIGTRGQKVNWHHLLWFKHHTPKHSIIAWIAMRGKLQTKDHLV